MWPFPDKQALARQTLNDVPISVAQDEHTQLDKTSKKAPTIEVWQDLVLRYANRVPIVSAACRYYNGATQRVTYDVLNSGTDEPVEDAGAKQIVDILNSHQEEMARAVELIFLIGEARQTYGEDGLRTHGAGELHRRGDTYELVDERGKRTQLEDTTRAWRTWEPDRRWSHKATSSHKSMLDLLEAFVIAYAEERAVSIRMAMNTGMVLVSEDVLGTEEGGVDVSDANDTYGSSGRARLERRFEQMLQMVIRNPRDAASLQPPVLVVPGDVKDKVAHVSFAQERDKRKIQERLDMLKREYAVGTDLPADIAAGFLADLNHWNARSVDANAWKNFLAPKIQLVANNAFEELAEGLGIDASGWKVVPNGSELVEPTVQADNANKAWDRGLISDAAYRKATGFNEDDAAQVGDGPAFPVGSQSAPGFTHDDQAPVSRRSFAAEIDRARLKRMSREIDESAKAMRQEILSALVDAAQEFEDEALTAASVEDPLTKLTKLIRAAILQQKSEMGLAAARAIATKRAAEWYERHTPEIEKRATRASKHAAAVLKRTVKDGTYELGVARDIMRSAESLAAGGSENVKANGDVNNLRPTITQEDKDFLSLLNGEVDKLVPTYSWVHGDTAKPFPPHEELDGETWVLEDEREVLANSETFPPSTTFYPGDHSGCTCEYDVAYEVAS